MIQDEMASCCSGESPKTLAMLQLQMQTKAKIHIVCTIISLAPMSYSYATVDGNVDRNMLE